MFQLLCEVPLTEGDASRCLHRAKLTGFYPSPSYHHYLAPCLFFLSNRAPTRGDFGVGVDVGVGVCLGVGVDVGVGIGVGGVVGVGVVVASRCVRSAAR